MMKLVCEFVDEYKEGDFKLHFYRCLTSTGGKIVLKLAHLQSLEDAGVDNELGQRVESGQTKSNQ
jgi:hypothetical protein